MPDHYHYKVLSLPYKNEKGETKRDVLKGAGTLDEISSRLATAYPDHVIPDENFSKTEGEERRIFESPSQVDAGAKHIGKIRLAKPTAPDVDGWFELDDDFSKTD